MAVAAFIDHWAVTIKNGRLKAFLDWLQKNEAGFAAGFPAGCRWLGMYGEVIGGENAHRWHMLLGLDSYGALDNLFEAVRDPKTEFGGLFADLQSYFDLTNEAKEARWLYRAAPTINVWE
jgi:hypothetical protein